MNNETKQPVDFYMQTPKEYNCAQAIVKAYGRDDLLDPLKSCGGGKAPDGLCGALYAALLLASECGQDALKQQFFDEIGDIHCQMIRKTGQAKCIDCVRIASKLLEQHKTCSHPFAVQGKTGASEVL